MYPAVTPTLTTPLSLCQVVRIFPMENNIGGITYQAEVVSELYTDYLVLVGGEGISGDSPDCGPWGPYFKSETLSDRRGCHLSERTWRF